MLQKGDESSPFIFTNLIITQYLNLIIMSFIKKVSQDAYRVLIICFILLLLAIAASAQNVYPMDQTVSEYYQCEWHVVVPQEEEIRIERIMTHYRCDSNSVSYADETSDMNYMTMLSGSRRQYPAEDGLVLVDYGSSFKRALIHTDVNGRFVYLAYYGIKGMYYSVKDKMLAQKMLRNLKSKSKHAVVLQSVK